MFFFFLLMPACQEMNDTELQPAATLIEHLSFALFTSIYLTLLGRVFTV
jgi:hypothetical protein